MSENITRRAALATTGGAAAAVAVLAGGGVTVAADHDPIFAAIEAHRAVNAEWIKYCDGQENDDQLLGEHCDRNALAAWAMLDVEPTTIAGVAALLAYVVEHQRHPDDIWPSRALDVENDLDADYVAANPQRDFEGHGDFEDDAVAWAAHSLERILAGGGNV